MFIIIKRCLNTAKPFCFAEMILDTSWETFLYTECIKKPYSSKESKKKRSDIFIFCSHFCSEKLEKC